MKYLYNILIVTVLLLTSVSVIGQGTSCGGAAPFCSGTSYTFPAGVNAPAAPASGTPGPNYGCLYTQPNPAWYYMQVGTSGSIELHMQGTNNHDIDFCCWGPFNNQTAPCLAGLTAGTPTPSHWAPGPSSDYPTLNMTDCSYNSSYEEWCYIPNGVSGTYYILLITNYSNQPQDIVFSQTNAGQAGAGTTNCGIMPPTTTNNGPICEGDTLKLFATPITNAQYFWSGPNNFSSVLQNPVIPNASLASAGDYYVVIMIGTQISPEDTTTVTVHPKPVVTATADTICTGLTASILASGAATYVWNPGGTTNPLVVSPGLTTNYTVIGSTPFGCKDTTTTFIQVNQSPVVTATSAAICEKDSATLTASGASTYLWSNGFNTSQIKISPNITTTYKVIGTSDQNCIDSTTTTVTVNPNPDITVNDVDICEGKIAQLTVINGSASYNYNWSNSNVGNTINVSPSTSTQYWVEAIDTNNCKDRDTALVLVHPLPIANFSADPNKTTTENPTIHFLDQSSNADIYNWNFGNVNSPSNTSPLQSPDHTYTGIGEYRIWLYVQSTFGCRDSVYHTVIIENPYAFYIPNAFSPNSINLENTTFKAKGIGIDNEKYEMIIFDRWGKEVFQTRDMEAGWNGKINNTGDVVPSGVYVYLIRFSQKYGVDKEFTGHVTLY